jgi:hypothetical protein
VAVAEYRRGTRAVVFAVDLGRARVLGPGGDRGMPPRLPRGARAAHHLVK